MLLIKRNDISALPASLRGIMDAPPSAVSADVVSDPSTHPLITCHVLDSTSGKPGAEMQIQLDHLTHSGYVSLAQSYEGSFFVHLIIRRLTCVLIFYAVGLMRTEGVIHYP